MPNKPMRVKKAFVYIPFHWCLNMVIRSNLDVDTVCYSEVFVDATAKSSSRISCVNSSAGSDARNTPSTLSLHRSNSQRPRCEKKCETKDKLHQIDVFTANDGGCAARTVQK